MRFGIPYAEQVEKDGEWYKICPICKAEILLTERKDFESFTGREYAEHYQQEHSNA